MTFFEWAAVVGAGSWLPQLWRLIHERYTRPEITITPAATVTLGYGLIGPNLTITSSFHATKRDALMTKMVVPMQHNDGERHTLTWQNIANPQTQIWTVGEHSGSTVQGLQPATALRVGVLASEDKLITFSDQDWTARANDAWKPFADLVLHQRQQGQIKYRGNPQFS